ncbi:MAG: outer membrane protein assembly factor BamE [Chlorobi bacterium]|nr:outer membrane protein assembly factor BamE [Chlorobiota bacterium]
MKTLVRVLVAAVLMLPLWEGCKSAADHRSDVGASRREDLTVGKVQREIRRGMSGAEVAEALGSPNIVTKDADGRETWVYDRIATEVTYSDSQNALFLILAGTASQSGAVLRTQKTLTVVIKFDDRGRVDSFTYHASKF